MALLYATDFYDQLVHEIIPALRAGYIVLADRYIYTLMARDIVRGAEPEWTRNLYSSALIPDAVFYLAVSPRILGERNLRKHAVLDYWESGMDIHRSANMYASFIEYQRQIQKEFKAMQELYGFDTVDGNRSPRAIQNELQAKIDLILNGKTDHDDGESNESEPDNTERITRPTAAFAVRSERNQPHIRRKSSA